MKKLLTILVILLFPLISLAQQGCCSWHGGTSGCTPSGRVQCSDGTISPSCTCFVSNNKTKAINYIENVSQNCMVDENGMPYSKKVAISSLLQ